MRVINAFTSKTVTINTDVGTYRIVNDTGIIEEFNGQEWILADVIGEDAKMIRKAAHDQMEADSGCGVM